MYQHCFHPPWILYHFLKLTLKCFISIRKSMDITFPNIAFAPFSLSFCSRTPITYILDTLCYLNVFYILFCVFHYFLFLCFNMDIFCCFHPPFHQPSLLQVCFPNLFLSPPCPSLSLSLCLPLPVLSQIIKGSLCLSIFFYFLNLLPFIISTILSICYCFCMTFASVSCLF